VAVASGAKVRHEVIVAYAAEIAGTDLDLDHNLESAGIEHRVKRDRARK
jgi:hypothetical protein